MKGYHFLSSKYGLEAIRDQRIKVSKLDDLNDPFEFHSVQLGDKEVRERFNVFKKFIAEKFRIICLCRTRTNPLVWSHYADRHKGVALEFEVPEEFAIKIRYQATRLEVARESLEQKAGALEDLGRKFLITKYSGWKYEEETRVFLSPKETISNENLEFYNFDEGFQLKGILLGPFCELSCLDIKTILPAGHSVKMRKTRLAFKSYKVVLNQHHKPQTLISCSNRD